MFLKLLFFEFQFNYQYDNKLSDRSQSTPRKSKHRFFIPLSICRAVNHAEQYLNKKSFERNKPYTACNLMKLLRNCHKSKNISPVLPDKNELPLTFVKDI